MAWAAAAQKLAPPPGWEAAFWRAALRLAALPPPSEQQQGVGLAVEAGEGDGGAARARARGFHGEEWLAAATVAAQLGLSPSAT